MMAYQRLLFVLFTIMFFGVIFIFFTDVYPNICDMFLTGDFKTKLYSSLFVFLFSIWVIGSIYFAVRQFNILFRTVKNEE